MALQTFGRGLTVPPFGVNPERFYTSLDGTTSLIDAANEVYAVIIQAPKTGNIRSVQYRLGTVTTGATITIGIYQVSATTGDPSNTPTAWAANTFITKVIADTDDNQWQSSGNFTADAAVVKGDVLAVCFINPGASAGNMRFGQSEVFRANFPYTDLFTGSWTKGSNAGSHLVLVYDDGSIAIPRGCHPMGVAAGTTPVTTSTFSSSSTPDVRGARFQFPGPVRVNGAWVALDMDGDVNIRLVDASWDGTGGDALATKLLDTNQRQGTTAGLIEVEFNTAVELAANTYYRLIVEPNTTTNLSFYDYMVDSADIMAQLPMGANFHLTTAKDPNDDTDWTNYNNGTDGYRIPYMGLFIDGIGDDAGGGGGGTGGGWWGC